MNLIEAAQLARHEMSRYLDARWVFSFVRSSKSFGMCKYEAMEICLSVELTEANERPAVLDTILHEIAHAIAGYAAGHGPLWQRWAVSLGCKPERYFSEADAVIPPPTTGFKGVCPACDHVFYFKRFVPGERRAHSSCRRMGLPNELVVTKLSGVKVAAGVAAHALADVRRLEWLVQANPKRGASAARFAGYMGAPTVAEYHARGGTSADLAWDMKKGYVKFL
jgi:hypothetical protein